MKHIQDDSGPRQTFTIGEGVYEINVSATPRQLFDIFRQAWNMRECVRLLTPGVSERQFTIEDQRWIKAANNSLDDMFRSVGLKLQRARELFAPDNCPDLIVPHVVFETEQVKPTRPTAPIHRPVSFAYCPRCGGVDTIRDAGGMKIKPILWPHIFRENQMANDMGCSCGE